MELDPQIFRTGDILLFRYEYLNCLDCGLIHGGLKEHENYCDFSRMLLISVKNWPCVFTHVAVIIVLDNVPYILDCTPLANINIDGVMSSHKVEIYDMSYLMKYQGNVYYHKYNGPRKDISYEFVRDELRLGLPFQADAITFINAILGADFCNRSKNTGTCVSNVLRVLNKLNIINTDASSYLHHTPADIHMMINNDYSCYDSIKMIRNGFYYTGYIA